jgi:protein-disulfide isomerase
VRQHLGDKLQFAFRDFPLTQIHPHAEDAAEMSEAAGAHGRFWQMHATLFQHQQALGRDHLVRYAAMVGVDPDWAESALQTHRFGPLVREDVMSGVHSGVNGTPTFFINGVRYDGSWEEPLLLRALQRAMGARH